MRSEAYTAYHGSPPRVRGTVSAITEAEAANRITPARAGNRGWRHRHVPDYEDHPRACGEQKTSGGKAVDIEGSPPRVRGTEAV